MARLDDYRAQHLAALADPALGVKLPVTVARAIRGYGLAMQARAPAPPQPGQAARLATADHALGLVEHAFSTGRAPAAPDPAKIAVAREREQAAIDRAAIAAEVRVAAVIVLNRICDENHKAVVGAIRARFAELMTELTGHARELPPGADERMALQEGGAVREHYLAVVDLVAHVEALRGLFRQVEAAPAHGPLPDLMELAVSYLTTPLFYDTRVDTSGTTRWGAYGTVEFYLGACREADPGDWWLPTDAERDDLADQIHEARRVARVKASAQ